MIWNMRPLEWLVLCALAPVCLTAAAESRDVARLIGAERDRCAVGIPPAPFQRREALDRAAGAMAGGMPLAQALERARYRAVESRAATVSGAGDPVALVAALGRFHCAALRDPRFPEFGVHLDAGRVLVVLAAPFRPPAAQDAERVEREVLERVNRARKAGVRCGAQAFPAVPPLRAAGAALRRAAEVHARDLAATGRLDHAGSDGSTPAERVTRAGYRWQRVGENVAAGPTTAAAVVDGWLASPPHCANLMSAQFAEMATAFAVEPDSPQGIYWVQVFGTPRRE